MRLSRSAQPLTLPHARAHACYTRARVARPQAGRYQEAFDSYTQALSIDRSDPRLFSNRSATCLKLNVPLQARVPLRVCAGATERQCRLAGPAGSRLTRPPVQAFRDGFYALTLLRSGDGAVDSAWTRALAKTLLLLARSHAACGAAPPA